MNYTSLFLVRLLAVIISWEALPRKITVEFATEMGPPAGWSEGTTNPSSQQRNVRCYRDGAIFGPFDLLLLPLLLLLSSPQKLVNNTFPNMKPDLKIL